MFCIIFDAFLSLLLQSALQTVQQLDDIDYMVSLILYATKV